MSETIKNTNQVQFIKESYITLFNAISSSQEAIEKRHFDFALKILTSARKEAEEFFISSYNMKDCQEKNAVNNCKIGIDITKEEIRDMIMYTILIHECRDSNIRDGILDKFENEPYYETLVGIFDEISNAYFKLGFEIHSLMRN